MTYSGFPVSCTQTKKGFTINQWHWWKVYTSKVPFEGQNSPDIRNLKRPNPKPTKYFRFQKIISFFLSSVEKFDEC